jgi:16S rRNA (guanine527-N7)-methyltransferase
VKHGEEGRELLREGLLRMGLESSDDQTAKLLAFEELLRDKALPRGFIAASDAERLLERHILDSARGAGVADPSDRTAIDLGSGAGLPGIVVAILVPGLQMTLVESMRRRVAFLELVLERLALENVRIAAMRAEELPGSIQVDLCLARAFAPIDRSWAVAEPLLSPERGRLVYFAGSGSSLVSLPEGSRIVESTWPRLESSGPLVIMGG